MRLYNPVCVLAVTVLLALTSAATTSASPQSWKNHNSAPLLLVELLPSHLRHATSRELEGTPQLAANIHNALELLQPDQRTRSREGAPFPATGTLDTVARPSWTPHWGSQTPPRPERPAKGVRRFRHPRQKMRQSNSVETRRLSLQLGVGGSRAGNGSWRAGGSYRSSRVRRGAVRQRLDSSEVARSKELGWMVNTDVVTTMVNAHVGTTAADPAARRGAPAATGGTAATAAAAPAAPAATTTTTSEAPRAYARRHPSNRASGGGRNVFRYNPNWPWGESRENRMLCEDSLLQITAEWCGMYIC